MKPEIALAGRTFDGAEELKELCRQWLEAYEAIASEYPSVKDTASKLTERIKLAHELFAERNSPQPSLVSNFCADDSYMEEFTRRIQKEDDSLDGDFPLGAEQDMKFGMRSFTVHELALIQLGLAHTIDLKATAINAPVDHIRKGFLLELEGLWREAVKAYRRARVFSWGDLFEREQLCRAKAKAEREKCPRCGSTDLTDTNDAEVKSELGEGVSFNTRTEERRCNVCKEKFKTTSDIYYCVKIVWRYKYDKEGQTDTDTGEDHYDLEEGASYSLPFITGPTLEILSVSADGDRITAKVRVGSDILTVSDKGEPVAAYVSKEYSVCGDCVHENLSMSLTIIKE